MQTPATHNHPATNMMTKQKIWLVIRIVLLLTVFVYIIYWGLHTPSPKSLAFLDLPIPATLSQESKVVVPITSHITSPITSINTSNITLSTFTNPLLAAHPKQSGAIVLESGIKALLSRAWLADHAEKSIDVQYFIWSTDNIGILATESLLRAADRGVKVRVIVDDLLIRFPDSMLLALAQHPNIAIKIYNPKHSSNTNNFKRVWNLVTQFKNANQRMHDKTFIVDNTIGITGGRNMAVEYYDFDHHYNFRDRDVLVLGASVADMHTNFEEFWQSPLTVDVEKIYAGHDLMQYSTTTTTAAQQRIAFIYKQLHRYAQDPAHLSPEMLAATNAMPNNLSTFVQNMRWAPMRFISDKPGKNTSTGYNGGGVSTFELAKLIANAKSEVLIESPYLVMPETAKPLFKAAIARGVSIKLVTNSMASTDNMEAFSGYANQRDELLATGLTIYEFKPDAKVGQTLQATPVVKQYKPPIFALHAKSMVVDSKIAFIGSFNFDPRSANLNTEVGMIIEDTGIASVVKSAIEQDMLPENSWNAKTDNPDQYVPWQKRLQIRLRQLLPLNAVL